MKNKRKLNGYTVVYYPEHPRVMVSNNWKGYIYEHILIAEKILNRYLIKGEIVHHEDHIRSNNIPENIKIFKTKGDHNRYHKGFEAKKIKDGVYVCIKTKCIVCGIEVSKRIYDRCWKCHRTYIAKHIPTKEVLKKLIWEKPTVQVAKDFGVSGKAVEKWCKKYNISKPPRGYWMKHKASIAQFGRASDS